MQRNTFESLLAQVDICEHGLGCEMCCWLWTGGRGTSGYGKCWFSGERTTPHRVLLQQVKGERFLKNDLALHTCDTRLCCNWHHLYKGTHQQNSNDMVTRGRNRTGEMQYNAKLNQHKIRQIRRNYRSGGWAIPDICLTFAIGKSTAQRILTYQDWKHLKGEIGMRGD